VIKLILSFLLFGLILGGLCIGLSKMKPAHLTVVFRVLAIMSVSAVVLTAVVILF
jgi:hypothetical protein